MCRANSRTARTARIGIGYVAKIHFIQDTPATVVGSGSQRHPGDIVEILNERLHLERASDGQTEWTRVEIAA